jgi:predicted component of type VI protein secretion system
MHTQQLTVNQQDSRGEVERSEEAAIAGEIARRFIELKELTSAYRATVLIQKMHALSMIHPEALWLVMSLLTGDLSEITRSYSDMGKERAKSKQAIEQERSRALAAIQTHFPHLAKAVIELRHITSEIGPPQKMSVQITKHL